MVVHEMRLECECQPKQTKRPFLKYGMSLTPARPANPSPPNPANPSPPNPANPFARSVLAVRQSAAQSP
ncbi:unnamed protein product [Lota lota]